MKVLLLGLDFHMQDPDGVIYTIKVFMFTDISLSVGTEAAMIPRRLDTVLDSNTLILYAKKCL